MDTANAPIFGVNTQARINVWNKCAMRLIGHRPKEIMGRSLVLEFIMDDFRTAVQAVLDRTQAGDETDNFELPLVTNGGRATLERTLERSPQRSPQRSPELRPELRPEPSPEPNPERSVGRTLERTPEQTPEWKGSQAGHGALAGAGVYHGRLPHGGPGRAGPDPGRR